MFESLALTTSYIINGFVERNQLLYNNILFSFLDINDKPSFRYPLKCRGMLCASFFEKETRKLDYWGRGGFLNTQFDENFEPVYDFLNMVLCVKDTYLGKLEEKITYLNGLKEIFKIKIGINPADDLNLTKLENIKTSDSEGWSFYKLNGPRTWVSSSPMVSFLTGILKESLYTEITRKFIKYYPESDFCTDNLEIIKKFWSNVLPIDESIFGVNSHHDYGANNFVANVEKEKMKQEALNSLKEAENRKNTLTAARINDKVETSTPYLFPSYTYNTRYS